MKLFRSLLIVSSAAALEFTKWDQPDEDAFSWIEPKSRLRREGDADDNKVLQFLNQKAENDKKQEEIEKMKSEEAKLRKEIRAKLEQITLKGRRNRKNKKNSGNSGNSANKKKDPKKFKKWCLKQGKFVNKNGKCVQPSKRNDYTQDDYEYPDYNIYDDYSDSYYDDYEDYNEDDYDILVGDDLDEEDLEPLIDEIIMLRAMDKKEFFDLAQSEGTQVALERFALREFSRKKLGRKLTQKEKEQRKHLKMHVKDWEVV